jgi:2'-5' RNA ligase
LPLRILHLPCTTLYPSSSQRQARDKQSCEIIPQENWHITLSFLGYHTDEDIRILKHIHTEEISHIEAPRIQLARLAYKIEKNKTQVPNILWTELKRTTTDELGKIKNFLEGEYERYGIKWDREMRGFRGHITLSRFSHVPFLPDVLPDIEDAFIPDGITLFESHLHTEAGVTYEPLFENCFKKSDAV